MWCLEILFKNAHLHQGSYSRKYTLSLGHRSNWRLTQLIARLYFIHISHCGFVMTNGKTNKKGCCFLDGYPYLKRNFCIFRAVLKKHVFLTYKMYSVYPWQIRLQNSKFPKTKQHDSDPANHLVDPLPISRRQALNLCLCSSKLPLSSHRKLAAKVLDKTS